jgi:hypothetical protein
LPADHRTPHKGSRRAKVQPLGISVCNYPLFATRCAGKWNEAARELRFAEM